MEKKPEMNEWMNENDQYMHDEEETQKKKKIESAFQAISNHRLYVFLFSCSVHHYYIYDKIKNELNLMSV